MLRILLVLVFSLAITLTTFNSTTWAHEGHEHDQEESKQQAVNIIGNTVGEESGKIKLQCPVMKTWFMLDKKNLEKTPKTTYKDKTYYFCCPGCKPQFEKDPDKYLKG